jgi:hypothetical protein
MKKDTVPNTAKPRKWKAYGILNMYGEFWTDEIFKTESEAWDYISSFSVKNWDLSNHTIVPCTVTIKL